MANARSSSKTFFEGIAPSAILQKRQSELMPSSMPHHDVILSSKPYTLSPTPSNDVILSEVRHGRGPHRSRFRRGRIGSARSRRTCFCILPDESAPLRRARHFAFYTLPPRPCPLFHVPRPLSRPPRIIPRRKLCPL